MAEKRADPIGLILEVTDRCQNSCLHCYNPWRGSEQPPQHGRLTRPEVIDVVRRIDADRKVSHVAVSGGEPLLRPDLPEIVGDLTDGGFDPVVITNGALLARAHFERFPADTLFEVTLFSADAAIHDRLAGGPRFDRVLRGLVEIERHRCRAILVFVVTSLNAHDAGRTLRLGLALGAQAILINRINLTRRSYDGGRHLVPTPEQLRGALRDADEVATEYGVEVVASVPVPPCVVDPREFGHVTFGWCARGRVGAYFAVSSTGLLRACNHSSGVLGDLRRQSFNEILSSAAVELPWSGPLPRRCQRCTHPLATDCAGGCPAAARECYGVSGKIDPIVELAKRRVRCTSTREVASSRWRRSSCSTTSRTRRTCPSGPRRSSAAR